MKFAPERRAILEANWRNQAITLKTPATDVNEAVVWRSSHQRWPSESPAQALARKECFFEYSEFYRRELAPIFEFLLPKLPWLTSKSTVIKVIPGNRGLK